MSATPQKARLQDIFSVVCMHYAVEPRMVRSKIRHRELNAARQMFSSVARHYEFTYPAIAAFLHRNHSTILISVRRMASQMLEEPELEQLHDQLVIACSPSPRLGSIWARPDGSIATLTGRTTRGVLRWSDGRQGPPAEDDTCLFVGHHAPA